MDQASLVGRRCKKLVAREFWLSGRMVDEYCAIFIEDDHGDAWKLCLDDENNTWELERVEETPLAGTVEGDSEFRYPIANLFIRFPVRDQVIQGLAETDLDTFTRTTIHFSSGASLVFDYEYATERTFANLMNRIPREG